MSIQDLIKELNDNDPRVKTYRQFWGDVGDNEARLLAEALKSNKTFTELTFEVTNFTQKTFLRIGQALAENTQLESVAFLNCFITDDQCAAILKLLQKNTTLTSLTIKSPALTDKSMQSAFEFVSKNTHITTLNLIPIRYADDEMPQLPPRTGRVEVLIQRNKHLADMEQSMYSHFVAKPLDWLFPPKKINTTPDREMDELCSKVPNL